MLCLSRKQGERIVIGDGPDRIILTALDSRPGVTKIGIQAPAEIPVHREEVYEQIQAGERA